MDLTTFIPIKLRSIFVNNAMRLSILNKGVAYTFQLTEREREHVNSILYQTGSTVSKLMNTPLSMLKHMKFSKLISQQLSNIYRLQVPQILNKALNGARVNSKMVWNFVLAVTTGKNYQ